MTFIAAPARFASRTHGQALHEPIRAVFRFSLDGGTRASHFCCRCCCAKDWHCALEPNVPRTRLSGPDKIHTTDKRSDSHFSRRFQRKATRRLTGGPDAAAPCHCRRVLERARGGLHHRARHAHGGPRGLSTEPGQGPSGPLDPGPHLSHRDRVPGRVLASAAGSTSRVTEYYARYAVPDPTLNSWPQAGNWRFPGSGASFDRVPALTLSLVPRRVKRRRTQG